MSRKFKLLPHYYDTDWKLYAKNEITLQPGLTVLVGCNGAGKTTLIRQMKDELDELDIPQFSYDNLHEGGSASMSKAAFYQDWDLVSDLFGSSEGETILLNIGQAARDVGRLIRGGGSKEIWLFFDAVDSGLSIDGMCEVKDFFNLIFEDTKGTDVYIIVSTNAYEFASGEQCFDVYAGKYRTFKDYGDYKKFILDCRKRKDKRYSKEEANEQ